MPLKFWSHVTHFCREMIFFHYQLSMDMSATRGQDLTIKSFQFSFHRLVVSRNFCAKRLDIQFDQQMFSISLQTIPVTPLRSDVCICRVKGQF